MTIAGCYFHSCNTGGLLGVLAKTVLDWPDYDHTNFEFINHA